MHATNFLSSLPERVVGRDYLARAPRILPRFVPHGHRTDAACSKRSVSREKRNVRTDCCAISIECAVARAVFTGPRKYPDSGLKTSAIVDPEIIRAFKVRLVRARSTFGLGRDARGDV